MPKGKKRSTTTSVYVSPFGSMASVEESPKRTTSPKEGSLADATSKLSKRRARIAVGDKKLAELESKAKADAKKSKDGTATTSTKKKKKVKK